MDQISIDLSRYQREKKGHTEKGRPPINEREAILKKVSELTGTPIPRWCRYDVNLLDRVYNIYMEKDDRSTIKNKAAYFISLLKIYGTPRS
jgi:hypothetical protein